MLNFLFINSLQLLMKSYNFLKLLIPRWSNENGFRLISYFVVFTVTLNAFAGGIDNQLSNVNLSQAQKNFAHLCFQGINDWLPSSNLSISECASKFRANYSPDEWEGLIKESHEYLSANGVEREYIEKLSLNLKSDQNMSMNDFAQFVSSDLKMANQLVMLGLIVYVALFMVTCSASMATTK